MEFVTIHYSMNQTYRVEQNAILNIVDFVFANSKNFKLISKNVKLGKTSNSIEVFIETNLRLGVPYKKSLENLVNNIEQQIQNLTNSKPKNISVEIGGFF